MKFVITIIALFITTSMFSQTTTLKVEDSTVDSIVVFAKSDISEQYIMVGRTIATTAQGVTVHTFSFDPKYSTSASGYALKTIKKDGTIQYTFHAPIK